MHSDYALSLIFKRMFDPNEDVGVALLLDQLRKIFGFSDSATIDDINKALAAFDAGNVQALSALAPNGDVDAVQREVNRRLLISEANFKKHYPGGDLCPR